MCMKSNSYAPPINYCDFLCLNFLKLYMYTMYMYMYIPCTCTCMYPQNGVYVLHVQYPSDAKYKVCVIHTHLQEVVNVPIILRICTYMYIGNGFIQEIFVSRHISLSFTVYLEPDGYCTCTCTLYIIVCM